MNYKQCEDFLELHKYNEDLEQTKFEKLRQTVKELRREETSQAEVSQTDKLMITFNPLTFTVATVNHLGYALKFAGYQTMVYCQKNLGDYRNRWKIGNKPLSQKKLCEAVEQIQTALVQLSMDQVPSRSQMELLITETLFLASDWKVLVWYGRNENAPALEEAISYQASLAEDIPYKMKTKSLKKQVFDFGKWEKVTLTAPGREAFRGACQFLQLIDFLEEKGLKLEERWVRAALEDTSVNNYFGVIGRKPLFVLDEAQDRQSAFRLKEDMEEYLSGKQVVLLMGATKRTDIESILETLCEKVSFVLTVAPPVRDRIPSYELAQNVMKYHPGVSAVDSMEEAIEILGVMLPKDGAVLAVGCEEMLSQVIAIVNREIF